MPFDSTQPANSTSVAQALSTKWKKGAGRQVAGYNKRLGKVDPGCLSQLREPCSVLRSPYNLQTLAHLKLTQSAVNLLFACVQQPQGIAWLAVHVQSC